MALTNYLLQSFIMVAIFYGLGLYGRVGLVAALSLCVPVYAANFVVSALWLNRFSYGPVEWLWRRLTYGRFAARERGVVSRGSRPAAPVLGPLARSTFGSRFFSPLDLRFPVVAGRVLYEIIPKSVGKVGESLE